MTGNTSHPDTDPDSLAHWRYALHGTVPYESLPKDRKRLGVQLGSQSCVRDLETDLSTRLQAQSLKLSCSIPEFLLTALFALIFRYTDQRQMVIAAWNRALADLPEDERALPPTRKQNSAVPVVIDLDGKSMFSELLSKVRSTYREGKEIGGVSESTLAELLADNHSRETPSPSPVGFMSHSPDRLELIRKKSDALSQDDASCPGEFGVSVIMLVDRIRVHMSYSENHFRQSFVETAMKYYCRLIQNAVNNPSTTIDVLGLTTPSDDAVQRTWSNGVRLPAVVNDLAKRLSEHARRAPDKVAIVDHRGSVSFAELERQANRLGHYLRQHRVATNVPVALCLSRSRELVIGYAAVAKSGGVTFMVDSSAPPDRIRLQLNAVAPAIVITDAQPRPSLAGDLWRVTNFETAAKESRLLSDTAPEIDVSPNHTRLLFATSGSSGQAKLVPRSVGYEIPNDLTADDRHVLKNDSGTTFTNAEIGHSLWSGGTIFIAPAGLEKHPPELARFITQHQITTLLATPSMLSGLLDTNVLRGCESIRRVQCAGELISPALRRRFFEQLNAKLIISYGCTESPGATSRTITSSEPDRGVVDVGRTCPGMEVYVLDSEMRPCPADIPGEIYLGGIVASCYLNDAASTARQFVEHPFNETPGTRLFRTGDRGRWLDDGTLEVLGRRDGWVKLAGYRIELGEIESALEQHSDVRKAVVTLLEDDPNRSRLVAYLTAESQRRPMESELRRFLSQTLPPYMSPSAFVYLDSIPTTSNGKVDRTSLPVPGRTRPKLETPYVAPRNDIEQQIAAVWCELLPVDRVGIDDDFLDLGGESLLAFQVYSRIENLFGRRLPLEELFERGTVRRLADLLMEADPAPNNAVDVTSQTERTHDTAGE